MDTNFISSAHQLKEKNKNVTTEKEVKYWIILIESLTICGLLFICFKEKTSVFT